MSGNVATSGAGKGGPVQTAIAEKLRAALRPVHLDVVNESFMHSVPPGSESHFKVVVVSEIFAGESRVRRHRVVHEALTAELSGRVHALTVEARTPSEWQASGGVTRSSPECLGGSKADRPT